MDVAESGTPLATSGSASVLCYYTVGPSTTSRPVMGGEQVHGLELPQVQQLLLWQQHLLTILLLMLS